MVFPEYRPRRMRRNEALRGLIRETTLSADQLIYPLFIVPGKNVKNEVRSMPGVHQISVDQLASEAKELLSIGVKSVMLFGIPEKKDGVGSGAHDKDGIVQRAIRELKTNPRNCSSSPMSVSVNTPTMVIADFWSTTKLITIRPWRYLPKQRCPTPGPAPISSSVTWA